MNVSLEYSKNQNKVHIFRIEDLNNNPKNS